jgi:hypothetical protein
MSYSFEILQFAILYAEKHLNLKKKMAKANGFASLFSRYKIDPSYKIDFI